MKEKFEFESLLRNPIGRALFFLRNVLPTFVFVRDLSTALKNRSWFGIYTDAFIFFVFIT